jgi:hypothetical protein
MQARSQPSTAAQLHPRGKVSVITKGIFLRGQLNRKFKHMQLGPFTLSENIGSNN